MVQTMFHSVGRVYFEVDVTLTAQSDLDVRDYLRASFLPIVDTDSVVTQLSDRDRPPLLKVTMWDSFQVGIREDAEQRKAVRLIKAKHKDDEYEGLFVSLAKAVKSHHGTTKELLESSPHPFTMGKVLLNGAAFNPEQ